jgi:hypothetical protein
MSTIAKIRRYLVPALRLTRFMLVWFTITVTLWFMSFPVIAREVFKGLINRNRGRRGTHPWARAHYPPEGARTNTQSQSQSQQQYRTGYTSTSSYTANTGTWYRNTSTGRSTFAEHAASRSPPKPPMPGSTPTFVPPSPPRSVSPSAQTHSTTYANRPTYWRA